MTLALGTLTVDKITCYDPFVSDPESWDCACHKIMLEKCNTTDLASPKFTACYRTQLCKNPKVCQSWKEKVCCVDNDDGLKKSLKREFQRIRPKLKKEQLTAFEKKMHKKCVSRRGDCQHENIGPIVKLNCPKTCGLCQLSGQANVEANMQQLDDALAGTATGQGGWTLTPITPKWTHTPTDDQSCFVDPEGFDCDCYAKKRRYCKNEDMRREHHMRHPDNRVYSATECEHFFVCTHSNTCQPYKKRHCQKEFALLKEFQAKGRKIETC